MSGADPHVLDEAAVETAATLEAGAPPRDLSGLRYVASQLWAAGIIWPLGLALLWPATFINDVWLVQAISLIALLTIPGVLLLRAIRVSPRAIIAFPIYVPCASLIVLMATGLTVNLIGISTGSEPPLRTGPLLAYVTVACVLLLLLGSRGRDKYIPLLNRSMPRGRHFLPLLLPAVAAAGATAINAGSGTGLAYLGVLLAAVALCGAIIFADRLSPALLGVLIWSIALALIWGYTLRGDFTYGFDITTEHLIAQEGIASGTWELDHTSDAYGALLSVTILPAILSQITGLSSLAIFKAVFPALFALLPAGAYMLARRFIAPTFAVAAAGLIIAQSAFFQQIPAIARQEIAFLLLLGAVVVVLDKNVKRQAVLLAGAFALGIVVSHYSTTYLAIAVFLISLTALAIGGALGRRTTFSVPLVVLLYCLAGGAVVWYGVLTNSADNVTRVAETTQADGLGILEGRDSNGGLLNAYLSGNAVTPITGEEYAELVADDVSKNFPWVTPLPEGSDPRYAVTDASPPAHSARAPWLAERWSLLTLILQQLTNLLLAAAAIVVLISRRTPPLIRTVAAFAFAGLCFLLLIRLSGTVAQVYNQERVLVQSLFPLGIVGGWLAMRATERSSVLRRVAPFALAAWIGITLLFTSGFTSGAFGDSGRANVDPAGEDAERFVFTQHEVSAATWLAASRPADELLYADRYGQLRMLSVVGGNDNYLTQITPQTLDRDAWVYGSEANVLEGRTRDLFGQDFAIWTFPAQFLADHFNTVYVNGRTKVFAR